MRICRYQTPQGTRAYGLVEGDDVYEVVAERFGDSPPEVGRRVASLDEVRLLAPAEPSKVVCVGRNYHSLLEEQGRDVPREPFVFLKTSNTVVGPEEPVHYPEGVEDVAHEGELAVVVGRESRRLHRDEAMGSIFGYTAANDVTVRDWQDPSSQWWRAKSSDTHCPIGPWIVTDLADPHAVRVRTFVNEELRQDGSTSDLVFDIPALLERISAHMTLFPGDVILTGTAAGIRPVAPGDVMRIDVEGVGALSNPVTTFPHQVTRPNHS